MSQEELKNISAVINTLNRIDVRGEENLDMMLGCIRVLQNIEKKAVETDG